MLAACSRSSHVWPGGTEFNDLGEFGAVNMPRARTSAPPEFGLELVIEMARREFWRFEPVELDVAVRTAAGVDRRFRIADEIDPGYESFRIWIEDPLGQRRIYRSPRRYCRSPGILTIGPGRSFRRDISIFGEAGGYTFRSVGVHKLWAEMLHKGLWLRSNTLEINVLPADNSERYLQTRAALTVPGAAGLLYHRLDRFSPEAVTALQTFVSEAVGNPSAAVASYALGRAFLADAEDPTVDQEKRARLLSEAADYLVRARDAAGIGAWQREIAADLVAERSQPPRRRARASRA